MGTLSLAGKFQSLNRSLNRPRGILIFLIYLFFPDKSKDGYTFMWNQWGVNWIMLSIMKILAVSSGSADFLKLGFATDVATVAMMIKGWIPEFKPFMLFFGLEMLAFGKLAFA